MSAVDEDEIDGAPPRGEIERGGVAEQLLNLRAKRRVLEARAAGGLLDEIAVARGHGKRGAAEAGSRQVEGMDARRGRGVGGQVQGGAPIESPDLEEDLRLRGADQMDEEQEFE